MPDSANLPVVDPSRGLASEALERGILETGFFLLRDHTMPLQDLHELRRQTYELYGQPLEEKMRYHQPARGYVALREEHVSAGFGTGAYGSGDCCEKYTIGPLVSDAVKDSDPAYYRAPEAENYFAPNVYPSPAFQQIWERYYRRVAQLSDELLGAIRSVLGLPPDEWHDLTDRPVSVMRFLGYPEVHAPERIGEHYDDDLLTVLHQSPTANGFDGLEVMLPGESQWRSVPADDEVFVVNTGEALASLTGGRVVATKHRVAGPPEELVPGSARSSVAYFYMPNWNARFRPVAADETDRRLGQVAESFHLEELKEPDGSVLFYKVQQRQAEQMKGGRG